MAPEESIGMIFFCSHRAKIASTDSTLPSRVPGSPEYNTPQGPLHVPTVPISVKAPVTASMLYIETLFEPELVT